MGQSGCKRAHHRQPVGALEVLFQFPAVGEIAQKQNAPENLAGPVLQRRNRYADRHLPTGPIDDISLAAHAFSMRRAALFDQAQEPPVTLEDCGEGLMQRSRCGTIGQYLGGLIKKINLAFGVNGNDPVLQAG